LDVVLPRIPALQGETPWSPQSEPKATSGPLVTDFIQLEHDAIAAYRELHRTARVERTARSASREFLADHERHLAELRDIARQ
jgi:hypothetical protein